MPGGADHLLLTVKKPFSFRETLWFLDRNLDDCMHRVENGKTVRAIRTNTGPVLVEVTGANQALKVDVLAGDANEEVAAFVNEWFDLDRDLRGFYKLLRADPDLSFLASRYRGFHIVGIPDLFECIVWSIAGQQISLPFAYTLKRRFVERFGEAVHHRGQTHWLFPTPERIRMTSVAELREMQFTTRKAEYIIGLADQFVSGVISKKILLSKGSETNMLAWLLEFRGIGPWTANYVLMKSVRAMNRVPEGDAGLLQALAKYKQLNRPGAAEVDALMRPFGGWKTYLVFYLWRSLREMA